LISKSTIDKVYDASRVEEVISDFVQLKKSGSNFKGLSPFSKEKTPSFMVSPTKQIWKDFSSGKGGNSVAFLMEHEQFSYPEAIKFLAKKYNIEVEETFKSDEEKEKLSFLESLYLVVQNANENFKKNLWEKNEGKALALTYLKERGFDIGTTQSCVTPVYLKGSVPEAMALVKDLRENYRIFCSIVVYPVIPKGLILLRLIPTATHNIDDINETLDSFLAIRDKLENGYYKKISERITI